MIDRVGFYLDRLIGVFAPRLAMERMAARQLSWSLDSWGSNAPGGYDAGKKNRLTKAASRLNENSVPRGQVNQLRWNSWDLYRNNANARKICRTLEAKVIGRGLKPSSQAQRPDGSAHIEFREAVKRLWDDLSEEFDYRGTTGNGGQHISDLQKNALRGVILGGDVLYTLRRRPGETIPLQLQLLHADRLADITQQSENGNEIFQGVELNRDGTRAAYWLYARHPSEPFWEAFEPRRQDAINFGHLYVAEDIDQVRGTPWFAAALMQMRDTSDYQYNELKASALAACIVLGYRRGNGQTGGPFVNTPDNWDLTDADGNTVRAIQPGMLIDLGQSGAIEGFNPARPSTSAEAWINHLIRSTASAMPGVKGSTLTGDYRNSSFSSEKSADNDAWPELEGLQDWFVFNFTQPIYREVIRTAVLTGYFDGIITESEFAENEKSFLSATWQGPVARSINPTDDAEAAAMRVANGTSSPQIESSVLGRDWRDILRDVNEFREQAVGLGVPETYVERVLGGKPEKMSDNENKTEQTTT